MFRVFWTFLFLLFLASGCSMRTDIIPNSLQNGDVVSEAVNDQIREGGLVGNDTDIIKSTVANANILDSSSLVRLSWSNPTTGSSGTVVAIDEFLGQDGHHCRSFKTSVTTFIGNTFYDGRACQVNPEEWILSLFQLSD